MFKFLKSVKKNQSGTAMVEWGTIVAFIVLPIAAVLASISESVVARGMDAASFIQAIEVHYPTQPQLINKDAPIFQGDSVLEFYPSTNNNSAGNSEIDPGGAYPTHEVGFNGNSI